MTLEISSAHNRAATAFNDVASAARIAIEALAKIAAEPGRAIEIVENSLTAIEVILRLSEPAEPAGSTTAVAILREGPSRKPTSPICNHNGSSTGAAGVSIVASCR